MLRCQSSTVFGTLGPAVVPTSPGKDLACFSNKSERDCGFACVSTSGCDGFMYALQGSGYCCLKSGPSGQAKLSDNGEQMYFKMKAAYSCSQHAAWGKCREDWMKPYCNRSCKRCSNCGDTPPPAYSCSQQAAWGKCREDWMKPYCNRSCKRCGDNCGSS
ncbi:hypothetical protein CHLNCDRAFT_140300 [Chlorella variabilis]|uniref:Apple domain-containing protein n=1 Tax=Chlorella variabilis TaxID=554065 RepID=E1Z6Q1_CHLVA|nr:hypothetical protein CHLNCDRAFT_140300 [Chlorella variabilis]EFN58688.1 hypothetical protein CHLNCDRAFT_140300 [Chlorella variabilis]|eukprot:XP_005850790.1 hypothetical protein CHLNCDRAFT_140300 [Chlorella variabilis]